MERIAIIDHDNHTLWIEDINDENLEKYNGSEQDYIDDNYNLVNYDWDYIVDTRYIPDDNIGDSIDLNGPLCTTMF